MRNLLLSGGIGHPFTETSDHLCRILARHGVESVVAGPDDWDRAIGDVESFDLLSFNALRWRMLPERYDHLRAANAYETSAALRSAVEGHLAKHRPLLALHTSCICFDDWERWGEILGACWDWDRSFHPLHGALRFRDASESTDEATTFSDEVYHGLRVHDPARTVIGWAQVPAGVAPQNMPPAGAEGIGEEQAVVWTRVEGRSRVLVDTLGHDTVSLGDPTHERVLRRGVAWLLASQE